MAELLAGTSGWSYPSWRPGFYPAGVANEGFLSLLRAAASVGRAELDGLPAAVRGAVRAVGGQVPDGFRFAVKMPPRALRSFGTFEERVRRARRPARAGAGRRREPARRRPARAAARLDGAAARARPPRRELGRRRGRAGGARERLGRRTRRSGTSASASRRTPTSSSRSSQTRLGRCSKRASTSSRTSGTRTSRRRPVTRRGSSSSSVRTSAASISRPARDDAGITARLWSVKS